MTSPANPRVKELVALRRRRRRDEAGLTPVEGYEELSLAAAAGVRPVSVYYCPEFFAGDADPLLLHRLAESGAELVEMSAAAFGKAAYRESPDGWLGVVPTVRSGLETLRLGESPLVAVCEGVEKPGNLGAMLRTADAAGVDALIAADPVTDWGNPNLVRASKGALFAVPVAGGGSAEVLDWLQEREIAVVAAVPEASVPFTEADLGGPAAIAVGAEKHGLSRAWLERADMRVRIPMFGHANSLNVATSAALLVYEAVRQRSAHAQRRP